jgi:hypothetical protein
LIAAGTSWRSLEREKRVGMDAERRVIRGGIAVLLLIVQLSKVDQTVGRWTKKKKSGCAARGAVSKMKVGFG